MTSQGNTEGKERSVYEYDQYVESEIELIDDRRIEFDINTKDIPISVKKYDIRLKSAVNCYDQVKLLNFTMGIKLLPKLI